jgi:signal transduction histidine kinase
MEDNDIKPDFTGGEDGRLHCPIETEHLISGKICLNIINTVPTPILIYDDKGHFLITNRAFRETFNVEEDRLPPECFTVESFYKFKIKNETFRDEEILSVGRSLEYIQSYIDECDNLFWFKVIKKPVELRPDCRGVLCVLNDVTAQKRSEEKLIKSLKKEIESNHAKNNLISVMSHDFKSPLNIILSSVELIEMLYDRTCAENKAEYFGKIKAAVKKMDVMIEDILMLNKAENKRMVTVINEIAIDAFCKSLIEEVKFLDKKKGDISFSVRNDSQMKVFADERILKHVLINLLSNAVKYSGENYFVNFDIQVNRQNLTFNVSNSGPGISEADIPKLFNAFYRGSNAAKISGSGLGLSIAKKFTELHGGTITVQSVPGTGTTFSVLIPLNACAPESEVI